MWSRYAFEVAEASASANLLWEVRVFTGRDAAGRPTQTFRTVHGGRRDARRVANELEQIGAGSAPAGRTVSDVLDAWVEHNVGT